LIREKACQRGLARTNITGDSYVHMEENEAAK
jgi:hypothetical protein